MLFSRAIGIFDSGVGGLSVLRHIRNALPHERLIYIADSGHAPYGDKPVSYVEQRCLVLAQFLIEQGAEAIVIACNTATAMAVPTLRNRFSLPIIAVEPAIKPAVSATRNGVIGVLATTGTLQSARFSALLERYANKAKIITQGCPGLVEQIERGDLAGSETSALVAHYIAPLLAHGVDTLVLGCTHYSFLAPIIAKIAGDKVTLIDTGAAIAQQLQRRLQAELPKPPLGRSATEFWSSDNIQHASRIISTLWGKTAAVQCLPHNISIGAAA